MKKIVITGANGQLGTEIRMASGALPSFEFLYTDYDTLDITDEGALEGFLERECPAFLVNCAAYTAVDRAEQEPAAAKELNARAPGLLARCCLTTGTRLIHISTDYVFDGCQCRPYTEEDPVSPLGVYGHTKREGEINALLNPQTLIIRTSWLYSRFGANFVKTMIRLGNEKPAVKVVFDQTGSPTCAADLAGAILKIIALSDHNPGSWIPGIYHYSNEGVCSWYDFALAIHRAAGISCRVDPVVSKDFVTLASRPHYSVLNKARIKSVYGLTIPHWLESLEKTVTEIKTR